MNIKAILAVLLNKREVKVDQSLLDDLVKKYDTESWFSYILKDRKNRWDLWETSFFLAKKLNSQDAILETGCGSSTNLIWFGQNGFNNLNGFDIVSVNIELSKELAIKLNLGMNLWVDDGLEPKNTKGTYNAIISLNWTHLLEGFDLTTFLIKYNKYLKLGGFHAIDIIDSKYNDQPNNQYLTSDWSKPESERKASEYKKRYSDEEVKEAAQKSGYEIFKVIYHEQIIPKKVFIFRKIK